MAELDATLTQIAGAQRRFSHYVSHDATQAHAAGFTGITADAMSDIGYHQIIERYRLGMPRV